MCYELPVGYGADYVVFETCRQASDGYARKDVDLRHLLYATWGMDVGELVEMAQGQRERRAARMGANIRALQWGRKRTAAAVSAAAVRRIALWHYACYFYVPDPAFEDRWRRHQVVQYFHDQEAV
jgi:hypothetical protein